MPFELFRVDERLIHGQVVVGWGMRLGIRYYVVVDDEVAASGWEQELYASAVPDDVRIDFVTVDEAARRFAELDARNGPGALITRDTRAMRALADAGLLRGHRINIGGLHAGPGRRRALDYVYVGATEEEDLERIADRARRVSARDLPTAREVGLEEILRG